MKIFYIFEKITTWTWIVTFASCYGHFQILISINNYLLTIFRHKATCQSNLCVAFEASINKVFVLFVDLCAWHRHKADICVLSWTFFNFDFHKEYVVCKLFVDTSFALCIHVIALCAQSRTCSVNTCHSLSLTVTTCHQNESHNLQNNCLYNRSHFRWVLQSKMIIGWNLKLFEILRLGFVL